MKSYNRSEFTEAEFIALVTLADKLIDRLFARGVPAFHKHAQPIDPDTLPQAEFVSARPPRAEDVADDPDNVVDLHDEIDAMIVTGTRAWEPVVRLWAQNFGVEDAPQPDRAGALMAVFNGYGRAATAYIRERGGLAGACIDTLARENIVAPEDAERIGKRIALNMVQVGTAIGLPIDHLIERSLMRRDDPDTLPLHGGLLGDTVDMTRPDYKA